MRPNAAKFDGGNCPRIASFNVVLVFRKVGDVNDLFVCYHPTYKVFRTKVYPRTPARLDKGRRRIMGRDEVRQLTIPPVDVSKGGVANAERLSPAWWQIPAARSPGELLITWSTSTWPSAAPALREVGVRR